MPHHLWRRTDHHRQYLIEQDKKLRLEQIVVRNFRPYLAFSFYASFSCAFFWDIRQFQVLRLMENLRHNWYQCHLMLSASY